MVDGTLQETHKPLNRAADKALYTKRKAMHCYNHICICDWQGKFRKVFVGFDGSVHDSQALRQTSAFLEREVLFDAKQSMLGDAGFAGVGIISSPTGNQLNAEQEQLRQDIKRHRVVIEFAFGYLKFKWRILRAEWRWDLEEAPRVFKLCCQLTNMLYRHRGYLRSGVYRFQFQLEDWEKELASRLPISE